MKPHGEGAKQVKVIVTVKEDGVEKSTLQPSSDSPRASSAIFVLLRGTVCAHAYLLNGFGYV